MKAFFLLFIIFIFYFFISEISHFPSSESPLALLTTAFIGSRFEHLECFDLVLYPCLVLLMPVWFQRKKESQKRKDWGPLCLVTSLRRLTHCIFSFQFLNLGNLKVFPLSWVLYFFLLQQIQPNKAARFAQLWNKIITSFREEDLIDDR